MIRYLSRFLLVLILIGACLIRARLLEMPLERDEGEYAYMAQQILRGVPPYAGAYSMKFPGIYAAYAVIISLFGQTTEGVRLGLLFVNAANILLVFFLARRLTGLFGGVIASVFYAFSSLDPNLHGLSANAEHFVLLPALAGLMILLKALERERGRLVFLSGIFFGAAFAVKQHGIFFGIFGFLYLLWYEHKVRRSHYQGIVKRAALFAAGAAAPLAVMCAVLYSAGAFDKFWFWTVLYGAIYINHLPVRAGIIGFSYMAATIAASPAVPFYLMAVPGLWLVRKETRVVKVFILGFFAASVFAVSQGLYFREHYFILALPVFSVFAGISVRALEDFVLLGGRLPRRAKKILPPVLFASALAFFVSGNSEVFFKKSPIEVSRYFYGANPFPESAAIADRLKPLLGEDDSLVVLGSEPQIYFYLNKRSPVKFIYMYPLLEPNPLSRGLRKEMMEELKKTMPGRIIFVHVRTSWSEYPDFPGSGQELFEEIFGLISEHYEAEGLADIISQEKTVYKWDDEARAYHLSSNCYVSVLRRKNI